MGVNFELKKKITVDGKDYESLYDVPSEVRAAIFKTLTQGGANTKTTIHINGETYSSVEDLPAPLRAIVGGLTSFALKRAAGATSESPYADSPSEPASAAVRPEPVLSMKMIVVAIGLAAMLFWLARLMF